MFSAIMILVVETAVRHSPHYTWGGALYLNIPFLTLILIILLTPLVGGILSVVVGLLWILFWLYYAGLQGSGGSVFDAICMGILCGIAGIVSIAFSLLNKNRCELT
jgi:hypothetical protein